MLLGDKVYTLNVFYAEVSRIQEIIQATLFCAQTTSVCGSFYDHIAEFYVRWVSAYLPFSS